MYKLLLKYIIEIPYRSKVYLENKHLRFQSFHSLLCTISLKELWDRVLYPEKFQWYKETHNNYFKNLFSILKNVRWKLRWDGSLIKRPLPFKLKRVSDQPCLSLPPRGSRFFVVCPTIYSIARINFVKRNRSPRRCTTSPRLRWINFSLAIIKSAKEFHLSLIPWWNIQLA